MVLSRVYGIGSKKAEDLVNKGITTIEDLKLNENVYLTGAKSQKAIRDLLSESHIFLMCSITDRTGCPGPTLNLGASTETVLLTVKISPSILRTCCLSSDKVTLPHILKPSFTSKIKVFLSIL